MRRFPRILLVPLASLSLWAAELKIGSSLEDLIRQQGPPTYASKSGNREIFIAGDGTRYELADGKIVKITQPPVTFERGLSGAPSGTSPQPSEARARSIAPSAPPQLGSAVFSGVPRATIVSDPQFHPSGGWGGHSEGITVGIDGKPLEDHQIYFLDCSCFLERFNRGLRQRMPPADQARFTDLEGAVRTKETAADESDSFQQRYGHAVNADPNYSLARWVLRLEEASRSYQDAEGQINYLERLRVKDRIHLDQAPNAVGKELRDHMKDAIARMQQARTELERRYPQFYESGRKAAEAEYARAHAGQSAASTGSAMQLFAYQSFDRTAMLEGLGAAFEGRTNLQAKPIFIPKDEQVVVLEQTTKPWSSHRGPVTLELSRIRVTSDRMRQQNGIRLPKLTLEGWVLSRDLRKSE